MCCDGKVAHTRSEATVQAVAAAAIFNMVWTINDYSEFGYLELDLSNKASKKGMIRNNGLLNSISLNRRRVEQFYISKADYLSKIQFMLVNCMQLSILQLQN